MRRMSNDVYDMSRKEAIALHRDMWRWIAEQIEARRKVLDIHRLKAEFCTKRGYQSVLFDCFCCEYGYRERGLNKCSVCPLDWEQPKYSRCPCELRSDEEEPVIDPEDGLYGKCKKLFDNPELRRTNSWKEQAGYARKIADLKEKEEK